MLELLCFYKVIDFSYILYKAKILILLIKQDFCLADFGGIKKQKNPKLFSQIITKLNAASDLYASPELKQQIYDF